MFLTADYVLTTYCLPTFSFFLQAMETWESTHFNLGHCHRKMGRLDNARWSYEKALSLSPNHPSTHAALAFVHQLQNRHDTAIQGYHDALALKPDDAFASDMLKRALEELFSPDRAWGEEEGISGLMLPPYPLLRPVGKGKGGKGGVQAGEAPKTPASRGPNKSRVSLNGTGVSGGGVGSSILESG
ncbi:unnamed protein product, partial [Choristocarpus tenellus]